MNEYQPLPEVQPEQTEELLMPTAAPTSRLTRKEQKKMMQQSLLFGGAAVILLIAFIFIIIPGLIRFTLAFLGPVVSVEDVDDIPPQTPILSAPPAATYSAQVDLVGYGEPKSTITLVLNGSAHTEIVAGDDGSFSIPVALSEGENKVSAYAQDEAGNESAESKSFTIIQDTQAPTLEVAEPQDGQTIELRKNQILTIKGTTEENAKVYVNGRVVFAKDDGSFSTTYQLQEGENTLMIEAIDQAGNKTEKELKVTFKL